jgi:nucleotide-binding universal stress UspA family protein
MKGYRKVLIAVNGSRDVLRKGLRLAGDERCWVTVVKVIPENEGDLELVGVRNLDDVLGAPGGEIAAIRRVAEAERALVKVRVESGDPAARILEAAAEERCDVVVVGRPRQGWLRRFLGDRVVERVVRDAPCPVLVVDAGDAGAPARLPALSHAPALGAA